MKRHPGLSYKEAQERTARINPELVRWYAGVTTTDPTLRTYANASGEVQKRINTAQAKTPGLSTGDAMRKVLDQDPELKARYRLSLTLHKAPVYIVASKKGVSPALRQRLHQAWQQVYGKEQHLAILAEFGWVLE